MHDRIRQAGSLLQGAFCVKSMKVSSKIRHSRHGRNELIIDAPLARIRLNSPARRNAASRAMCGRCGVCARIEERSEALVVVVDGAGGHFCSGADISEFPEVYRDAAATREYVDAIQHGLAALAALDRPTIAALSGVAVGGGLAIAICCDLRFCAEDAYLAMTPAKLGLLYGHFETRRLVELVGSRGQRICCSAAGASTPPRR